MPDTDITRREHEKKFDRLTTINHLFHLQPFKGFVMELEDVHFHFDSAVILPDFGTFDAPLEGDPAAPDPATQRVISLAVVRACYLQGAKGQKMLIAGHADTSGSPDYNFPLSLQRANSFFHLLMGNRAEWVKISVAKHKVEDYQQILKWIANVWDFNCDPGNVDNNHGALTTAAVKDFQTEYNEEFDASISVDGQVGPETWGAFFDVYIAVLANIMDVEVADLQKFRDALQWVDDSKRTVGCGEEFPIEQPRKQNYKSKVNRRVEILFYDPGQEPKIDCHPGPTKCTPVICEIYNPKMYKYVHLPVDPVTSLIAFRIKMELGDIDSLFTDIGTSDDTDTGIRERMQAIGFLYAPLNDPAIATRAKDAWDHFKVVTTAGSAQLQTMVKNTIVDQNVLPAVGGFGMLRMPGSYCVTNAQFAAQFFGNPGATGAQSGRFQEETAVWTANDKLGLVPIVTKVESRPRTKWKPAKAGVKVHLQLIPPDAPPAGSPVAAPGLRAVPTVSVNVNGTPPPPTVTFTMTGSPAKFVTDTKAQNAPVANDPQVDNVHSAKGGKRGNAVAGTNHLTNVLEITTARPGFHGKFSFNASAASTHANAVMADTNNDGKAGFILMPAWTGGDRYKLRAFLDPVRGKPFNGTEGDAVKAESGTMVVWRILRFSNYMRWDYPAGVPAAEVNSCGGPLDNFDFAGVIATEYKNSWFDTVIEPNAASFQLITQAQWQLAQSRGRAAIAGKPLTSQKYDLNTLFPLGNNPSSGLIRFLTAAQYDAAVKGPPPPGGWLSAAGDPNYFNNMVALQNEMIGEYVEFFSKNAVGGLTVLQAPCFCTLSLGVIPTAFLPALRASGLGTSRRGCIVCFGHNIYAGGMPYDANHNTMHETGHVMYGVHQYTAGVQVNVNTGTIFDEHDYHDLCIMGYMRCSGGYCGRCTLNHAGWNTHAIAGNNPGP